MKTKPKYIFKEIVLIDVEKDLWSSGDWREQIKVNIREISHLN